MSLVKNHNINFYRNGEIYKVPLFTTKEEAQDGSSSNKVLAIRYGNNTYYTLMSIPTSPKFSSIFHIRYGLFSYKIPTDFYLVITASMTQDGNNYTTKIINILLSLNTTITGRSNYATLEDNYTVKIAHSSSTYSISFPAGTNNISNPSSTSTNTSSSYIIQILKNNVLVKTELIQETGTKFIAYKIV